MRTHFWYNREERDDVHEVEQDDGITVEEEQHRRPRELAAPHEAHFVSQRQEVIVDEQRFELE